MYLVNGSLAWLSAQRTIHHNFSVCMFSLRMDLCIKETWKNHRIQSSSYTIYYDIVNVQQTGIKANVRDSHNTLTNWTTDTTGACIICYHKISIQQSSDMLCCRYNSQYEHILWPTTVQGYTYYNVILIHIVYENEGSHERQRLSLNLRLVGATTILFLPGWFRLSRNAGL